MIYSEQRFGQDFGGEVRKETEVTAGFTNKVLGVRLGGIFILTIDTEIAVLPNLVKHRLATPLVGWD